MRKLSLLAAAVALVGFASPARAANWSLCATSSNGFLSCASAVASVSGSTLTVEVTNLYPTAGDEHVVTGFGFYYFGAGLPTIQSMAPVTGWELGAGSLGNPGPAGSETWFGAASTAQGTNDAIGWNSSQLFTFTLSGNLTEEQLASMSFAFRAQATGPNGGGSTKCYPTDLRGEHICTDLPTTVVPEPATVALMGTGLLGLGGFGALRRRRGNVAI